MALECGFTPDSKYIYSGESIGVYTPLVPSQYQWEWENCICPLTHCVPGSQDGTVHIWSAETGERVTVLDGGHPGPTHCVLFNPKLMTMTTACTNMVRHVSEASGKRVNSYFAGFLAADS